MAISPGHASLPKGHVRLSGAPFHRAHSVLSGDSGQQDRPRFPLDNSPTAHVNEYAQRSGAARKKSSMNLKEGTRRLGIVRGLCGAILGGYLERSQARAVWHNYRASSRFESLSASPMIQKVAKAIRDSRNGPVAKYPWINYRFNQQSGSWDTKQTLRAFSLIRVSRALIPLYRKLCWARLTHNSVNYPTLTFSPSRSGWHQ